MDRIKLEAALEIECQDGSVYEVTPGARGRGLSLRAIEIPLAARPTGSGRPPRPSTLHLRDRLEADGRAGHIEPGPRYIEWLQAVDPALERAVAANTVYRERRAAIEAHPDAEVEAGRANPPARRRGDGSPGRKPSPATVLLRSRLEKDAKAGKLREPKAYVKWLAKRADIPTLKARPIVYRERRKYA